MMSTRTVPAAEVHLGDLVLLTPAGPVRQVTLHRLRGPTDGCAVLRRQTGAGGHPGRLPVDDAHRRICDKRPVDEGVLEVEEYRHCQALMGDGRLVGMIGV